MTMANADRVVAGHKANLSNPNTSEESKERSRQEIERLSGQEESATVSHEKRVLAGYKATLSNPKTSEDAKLRATEKLTEAGVELETEGSNGASSSAHQGTKSASPEHEHRHIGGLKAALNNPNVSEEAKDRAQAELESAGFEIKSV